MGTTAFWAGSKKKFNSQLNCHLRKSNCRSWAIQGRSQSCKIVLPRTNVDLKAVAVTCRRTYYFPQICNTTPPSSSSPTFFCRCFCCLSLPMTNYFLLQQKYRPSSKLNLAFRHQTLGPVARIVCGGFYWETGESTVA
jgi:hypothetical protein